MPFGSFETVGATVSALNIHPLKAAAAASATLGQKIESFNIQPSGPEYQAIGDREFVLGTVLDHNQRQARFLSRRGWDKPNQIRYPGDGALATLQTQIFDLGMLAVHLPKVVGEHNGYKDMVLIDLNDVVRKQVEDEPTWDVAIHSGVLRCFDMGDGPAEIFSRFVNDQTPESERSPHREVRLFARDRRHPRLMRPEYRLLGVSHQVAGADGAPLLVANTASLAALEGDDAQKDPRRVGANIWVDGLEPFAEDKIAALQIGEQEAIIVALNGCSRCVATGVNPQTGRQENNFLPMLKDRRGSSSVTNSKNEAYFGTNFAPVISPEVPSISVGDVVKVAWAKESVLALR